MILAIGKVENKSKTTYSELMKRRYLKHMYTTVINDIIDASWDCEIDR